MQRICCFPGSIYAGTVTRVGLSAWRIRETALPKISSSPAISRFPNFDIAFLRLPSLVYSPYPSYDILISYYIGLVNEIYYGKVRRC